MLPASIAFMCSISWLASPHMLLHRLRCTVHASGNSLSLPFLACRLSMLILPCLADGFDPLGLGANEERCALLLQCTSQLLLPHLLALLMPYLSPADGFDPLGLGANEERLAWFAESERVHCRWAMLGVAGILVQVRGGAGCCLASCSSVL